VPRMSKTAAVAQASTPQELRDLMWKSADKLRGSMDASQYMDFVLGLIFLKYVSDAFAARREQLEEELRTDGLLDGETPADERVEMLDDRDEYTSERVFWVPEAARWDAIADAAKTGAVGERVDAAMEAVMAANPELQGALATIFNRDNVDQVRLAGLVDLISNANFRGVRTDNDRSSLDLLGEVYEYFLGQFASAQGKRGGEFYTPRSVVRTLVEILEPVNGKVYDPCCGSGGMFVHSEEFVEHASGQFLKEEGREASISVYGQELNERTWRLARTNLAIHGIFGDVGDRWGDTFSEDRHPTLRADYILANPPFNVKDWARSTEDARWRFGVPPARNANYAWLQHIWSKLAEGGTAGVVLANGSMSSNTGGEGEIRKAMVDADTVAAMIALPGNLFRGSAIPVCLWILTKDKSAGRRGAKGREQKVLFIDARNLGTMINRVERVFSNEDIQCIANTWRRWRGTKSAQGLPDYKDEAGFCYSATLNEIAEQEYALTPGRYVGSAAAEEDDEPLEERIDRLKKELLEQMAESERLAKIVREELEQVHA
jgi:type I restriction enzyme M protein